MGSTYTIKECLAVLTIIYNLDRQVFHHHLRKCLRNLVLIALIYGLVPSKYIRLRDAGTDICDRVLSCRKSIRCLAVAELCKSADVACVKLLNLFDLISADRVKLAESLIHVTVVIEECIVRLQNSGIDLDE